MKDGLAKFACQNADQAHIAGIAVTCGVDFGWKHKDWKPSAPAIALERDYPDREKGKTIFWLCDTIAPLLRRLSAEGELDVECWFAEYVLSEKGKPNA